MAVHFGYLRSISFESKWPSRLRCFRRLPVRSDSSLWTTTSNGSWISMRLPSTKFSVGNDAMLIPTKSLPSAVWQKISPSFLVACKQSHFEASTFHYWKKCRQKNAGKSSSKTTSFSSSRMYRAAKTWSSVIPSTEFASIKRTQSFLQMNRSIRACQMNRSIRVWTN